MVDKGWNKTITQKQLVTAMRSHNVAFSGNDTAIMSMLRELGMGFRSYSFKRDPVYDPVDVKWTSSDGYEKAPAYDPATRSFTDYVPDESMSGQEIRRKVARDFTGFVQRQSQESYDAQAAKALGDTMVDF